MHRIPQIILASSALAVESALGALLTSPSLDRQMLEMFARHRSMFTSIKRMNAYLDERLKTEPHNPDLHACRAQILSDRNKHTQALKRAQAALQTSPNHKQLLWIALQSHHSLRRWAEGEAVCAHYRSLYEYE